MRTVKRFWLIVLLLATLSVALADSPDEEYVRIYDLIQEADSLSRDGQTTQARAKYLQAQTDLQTFQKANPSWNPKVVSYRLKYLAAKIPVAPAKTAPPASSTKPSSPSVPLRPAATSLSTNLPTPAASKKPPTPLRSTNPPTPPPPPPSPPAPARTTPQTPSPPTHPTPPP